MPASEPDCPESVLPAKPREGQACTGCGWCCIQQPCQLAQEFLQCTVGPCVALEYDDGRTYCGLVRNPITHLFRAHGNGRAGPMSAALLSSQAELSVLVASTLRLGAGCDSADPDEPPQEEVKFP